MRPSSVGIAKSGGLASDLLVAPAPGTSSLEFLVLLEVPKNITYPMDATSTATTTVAMILPGVHNFEAEAVFSSGILHSHWSVSGETGTCRTGSEMWYSSADQFPRSISRHRSEQNGLFGLSFQTVGLPQIGHFMITLPRSDHRYDTTKMPAWSLP